MQEMPNEANPDGFFNDTTDTNACSVRVAVRVRPLVGRELLEGGQRTCVDAESQKNSVVIGDKSFAFDKVFASEDRQDEVFDICARNLVLGCFAGFNATILAYGQTGSGKTFTMGTGSTFGADEDSIGIVQFLELYHEDLHDLLDPASMGVDRVTGKPLKELQIREEKNGTISIQGLKEEIVTSKEQCLLYLNKGIAHRTTSATMMNEASSRSHAIFTVSIEQKITQDIEVGTESGQEVPNQSEEHITAKFHFVDLAGSERIKKTGATGQIMKEGISINKGLLALGNVISALTQESQKIGHIPYRDSKLTRILQDSLGGNSRTTMIACVSPAESNYEESINSLKYASRARNIKNKPVINRDPNSMLIDSLRTQISTLQGEITEYQKILKDNNIELSEEQKLNLQNIAAKAKTINKSPTKINYLQTHSENNLNNLNSQDMREVKIKLSKKEKELKDLQEQLAMSYQKLKVKEQENEEITKERDSLRLKNEILNDCLKKNNLQTDDVVLSDNKQTLTLIDEYKSKIAQLEQLLEKKDSENQAQNKKFEQIKVQQQRDEDLLKKQLEENQRLQRQLKKFEEQGQSLSATYYRIPGRRTTNEIKQETNNKKTDLEKLISQDLFSEKFMNSLSNKLESLFSAPDGEGELPDKINDEISTENDDSIQLYSIDEKEKILDAIKNSAKQMQGELVEMMKNEYDKKITEIEKDMIKVDQERQSSIKNVSNDSKQVQALETQYKQKMEDLQKQLKEFKENEKKQETLVNQITSQQTKIKTYEGDINKMKKSKEQADQQVKSEIEKFNKFKKVAVQELSQAKKAVADKDKIVQKLKIDLKKTDQLAQNKLAELRGMQKRSREERMKREKAIIEENEAKGIDIDRIRTWINENTNKMLECRNLKDQLEKQVSERDQIEEDMLGLGDKLSDLMLQKERKQVEKKEIELQSEGIDEGKLYELEEELDNITMEMQNITDQLDSMDETLDFISNKINILSEEITAIDIDNIQPLSFSGLKSVEAAKVTLQTFFGVLLDLNIYKRDLESKCIEQDEEILALNDKIRILQVRIDELISNGSVENMPNMSAPDRIMIAQNTKAINKIVESLDGFVEYSELKNLNLTANEQTSLTKLSLSKIVSNLKSKLKEEETKNQNLSHKLEQAINEKEQVKQKFENFKKQKKQESFSQNPLAARAQKQDQSVPLPTVVKKSSRLEFKFKSRMKPPVKKEDVPQITINKRTPSRNQHLSGQNLSSVQKTIVPNLFQKKDQVKLSASMTREYPALNKPHLRQRNAKTPRKIESIKYGDSKDLKADLDAQFGGGPPKMVGFKERRVLKKESSLLEIKVTNMQTSTTTTSIATSQTLKDRRMQKKLGDMKNNTVKPVNSRPSSRIASNNRGSLQSQPVQQLPIQIPSLKDKRNIKKAQNEGGEAIAESKIQDLDNIKEKLQSMPNNKKERAMSRAKEFQKLGERNYFGINSGDNSDYVEDITIHNVKANLENKHENQPLIQQNAQDEQQKVSQQLNNLNNEQQEMMKNNEESNQDQDQPVEQLTPNQEQMNSWTKDELLIIENKGYNLVNFDCVNCKLMMVFSNFNLEEYDIITEELTNQLNLKEMNGKDKDDQDVATALTVDKELGMIAVGSTTGVYIFDYQDNFTLVTKIELLNIKQICFCQFNVVVLSQKGNTSQIILYSLDEDFQSIGSYDIEGLNILLKTDDSYIYYSLGTSIGKLSVPDLKLIYLADTEHTGPILDFSPSSTIVFTTSKDLDLRGMYTENGIQVIPTIEELQCDALETQDNFLLTRCGEGSAFLVWKQSDNLGDELILIDEIDQEQFDTEALDFKMKGKVTAKIQGLEYNLVLMITTTPEAYIVQALKHKPLYS